MMKYVSLCLLLFSFPIIGSAEFRGYTTLQSIVSESTATSQASLGLWNIANLNRINWIKKNKSSTWEFGYEFIQLYESAIDSNLKIDWEGSKRDYRIFDFNNVLLASNYSSQRRYLIMQNLDRLSYTYTNGYYELILGRQQVSLGVAKLFAPTDIFAPFSLVTLNTEERMGVDAIRFRQAVGDMGEWEIAVLLGQDLKDENNASFIRYIHFLSDLEIAPIIGRYQTAWTVGFDVLWTVKGANIYFETLNSFPKDEQSFNRFTIGYEYQIAERSFMAIEYHSNGAGSSNKDEYNSLSDNFFYESGAIGFYGSQYLGGLLTYQRGDLDTFGANIFFNLNDQSFLLSPSWTLSISDNSSFSIAGFLGVGDDGTTTSTTGKKKSRVLTGTPAEFSNYGKSVHTKYIYYF